MPTATSNGKLTMLEYTRLPLCLLACKDGPLDIDYETLAILSNTSPAQLCVEMVQIGYKMGLLYSNHTIPTAYEKAARGSAAAPHATSNKHGSNSHDINNEPPLKEKSAPAKTSEGNDGQITSDQNDDISDTSDMPAGNVQEAVEGVA